MRTRLLALALLALVASGCATSFPPDLLHQRGSTIWIMDGDGKSAKSLAPGTKPRWIWAGHTHFAYYVPGPPVAGQSVGTIHVVEWDAAKQAIVKDTAVTDAKAGEHFGWSRDGLWLVFDSYRDGNWEIYKVRRDGSQLTDLSNSPAADREPAWSRAGPVNGKIVFVSNRTGDRDLFVIDENGGGLTNLTAFVPGLNAKPDGGDDFEPTWSSDGDHVAFVGTHEAWTNFQPQIYVTTVSQPGSLLVVSDPAAGAHAGPPRWLDRNVLVFAGPGGKLWRYDLDKNARTQIAANVGMVGDQCSSNPAELYLGTAQGIQALFWNVPYQQRLVGPGFNPCRDGDCH